MCLFDFFGPVRAFFSEFLRPLIQRCHGWAVSRGMRWLTVLLVVIAVFVLLPLVVLMAFVWLFALLALVAW